MALTANSICIFCATENHRTVKATRELDDDPCCDSHYNRELYGDDGPPVAAVQSPPEEPVKEVRKAVGRKGSTVDEEAVRQLYKNGWAKNDIRERFHLGASRLGKILDGATPTPKSSGPRKLQPAAVPAAYSLESHLAKKNGAVAKSTAPATVTPGLDSDPWSVAVVKRSTYTQSKNLAVLSQDANFQRIVAQCEAKLAADTEGETLVLVRPPKGQHVTRFRDWLGRRFDAIHITVSISGNAKENHVAIGRRFSKEGKLLPLHGTNPEPFRNGQRPTPRAEALRAALQ